MSRQLPPRLLNRFFRWFCREELCDAVEGDLLEVYRRKVLDKGAFRANTWYLLAVISFLQPFALRKDKSRRQLSSIDMLANYFKIAYRNLIASKLFTILNVSGLAIGIAGFVIMIAYVRSELSYDQFHTKHDRIVRVAYAYNANDTRVEVAKSAFPIKPMLLEEYPGVEAVVRFYRNTLDATTLRYEDKHFTEEDILFADPEVFQVFDFELERGNPATALTDVNSIVMTAAAAKKYFGNEDPIGRIIEYQADDRLQVTGILKEVPENSHIQFDMLVPVELQRQRWMRIGAGNNGYDFEQDWQWSGAWQYVLLENEALIAPFEEKLIKEGKHYFGRPANVEYDYWVQPVSEIYLTSDFSTELEINGNLRQVYGFMAVAILILFIACINFINLSTARSVRRAKEVGLRKVMGALRTQLVIQFIAESVLIALLATTVAIGLAEVMLPYFNQFMGKSIAIHYLTDPLVIPSFLMGGLVIGFMAGIYPAFYVTRFQAVKTLKGNTTTGSRGNARLQKALVTSQFLVANLLIIGILVVQQQLNYIKNKDLGFNKDQIIILKHGSKMGETLATFKTELEQLASVAVVNQGYVAGTRDFTQTFKVDGEQLEAGKGMGMKHVSLDFLDMFEMELVAGRNFKRGEWRDWKRTIMLNEAAVRSFGWTNEEALGKKFSYIAGPDNRTRFECKVIGIVADAHLESLHRKVRPSVFKRSSWGDISVKLNAVGRGQTLAAIDDVEAAWNEVVPEWPFEYDFLDDTIAAQYLKEERLGQTMQFFTVLAIFIASLGLFGLASFTVQQRTREIGVRKVLGASIFSILTLVSKRFFTLIAISFLISVPLGYYLTSQWLQDFEFRVSVGPETFVVAGLFSVIIAALAIGGQSLRAASLNPVKTLKHE